MFRRIKVDLLSHLKCGKTEWKFTATKRSGRQTTDRFGAALRLQPGYFLLLVVVGGANPSVWVMGTLVRPRSGWAPDRQHKAPSAIRRRSEQPDKASGPVLRSCVDETSVKSPGMSHVRPSPAPVRTARIEPDGGDQSQSGGLLAQTSDREPGSIGSSDARADNDQRCLKKKKKKLFANRVGNVVAKGPRDESSCLLHTMTCVVTYKYLDTLWYTV